MAHGRNSTRWEYWTETRVLYSRSSFQDEQTTGNENCRRIAPALESRKDHSIFGNHFPGICGKAFCPQCFSNPENPDPKTLPKHSKHSPAPRFREAAPLRFAEIRHTDLCYSEIRHRAELGNCESLTQPAFQDLPHSEKVGILR